MPDNLGEFKVPLGVPEILRTGSDLTLVTYGACCKLALEACKDLEQYGVEVELIDVQTLLPFDRFNIIGTSLEKTGALLCLDEDMPGGAAAYMLDRILVKGDGYKYLDCSPKTLCASAHRPAYGSDGDYYSKPNKEDIELAVFKMMTERKPDLFSEYASIADLKLRSLS
jgi:pyruvate/2-oxoglutarate/acetoin dehydrogenase E1 component